MSKEKQIIEPIDASLDDVAQKIMTNKRTLHQNKYKAIYQGRLPLEELELDCAILDDKENTRVINMTSIFKAFGRIPRSNNRLINIPAFMDAQNLQPFIDQKLLQLIKPIEYMDGQVVKVGYNALILPALCNLYLKARRTPNTLTAKQAHLAEKAEILQSSFANVGMIALIDEATGFQIDRKHDALRLLLSKYIAEGLQKWLHTFPDSFFLELDRLYNNEPTTSRNRPQYYGLFINKYIYDPIENGYVKNKLDELNIQDNGKRKARFHQWLSSDGRTILIHQIGRVQMLIEMCQNINQFKKAAENQKKVLIAPYLFDEMNEIIQN